MHRKGLVPWGELFSKLQYPDHLKKHESLYNPRTFVYIFRYDLILAKKMIEL